MLNKVSWGTHLTAPKRRGQVQANEGGNPCIASRRPPLGGQGTNVLNDIQHLLILQSPPPGMHRAEQDPVRNRDQQLEIGSAAGL